MGSEMSYGQVFKADGGKLQPTLMFKGVPDALDAVVNVFGYGAQKYEAHSWKRVDSERYEDALLRHTLSWQGGEERDKESGILHLAHMAWNCLTLLQTEIDRMKESEELVGVAPWLGYNKPPTNHKAAPVANKPLAEYRDDLEYWVKSLPRTSTSVVSDHKDISYG